MAQPGKPDGWILFVRHSESCANQLKAAYKDMSFLKEGITKLQTGMRKIGYRDPELTELGEAWATLRGQQLAPYVSPTTKMFASTLFRTQLTAMLIREGIQDTNRAYDQPIHVLPNSSEVSGISYLEEDNAPLNPADFLSFSERMEAYKNHLLKPTSVYTTHPSYDQFIQALDRYNKSSNHQTGSELVHNALRANPLYSRIEKKISKFTYGDRSFEQPPESKRKAAVASNPEKLALFLKENKYYILNPAARKRAVETKSDDEKQSSVVEKPILIPTSGSRVKVSDPPKKLFIDHLDAIIVSHGGVMKAIIQSLGGKRPEIGNLDAILFRILDGKIAEAYLMPMPDRKSAVELGFSEIDKSCLVNTCQSKKRGGSLQTRRRSPANPQNRTRRHRRRGRGRP